LYWRELHYNSVATEVKATFKERAGMFIDEKLLSIPFTGRNEYYEPTGDAKTSQVPNNPEVLAVSGKTKRGWNAKRRLLKKPQTKDVGYSQMFAQRRAGYVSGALVQALQEDHRVLRTEGLLATSGSVKANATLLTSMKGYCTKEFIERKDAAGVVARALQDSSTLLSPEVSAARQELLGNTCLFVVNLMIKRATLENVRKLGDTATPLFGDPAH
jgi:hypothetical protein